MNIAPQPQTLPVATAVNVQTDALRRENNLREVIVKPEAASQSAAEKGAASERERAKNPGQSHEGIDFEALRKQAEERDTTINGEREHHQQQHSSQQENSEQNNAQESSTQNQDAGSDVSSESNVDHQGHSHTSESDVEKEIEAAEQQVVKELQARDREVRAHELAHAAVGGATTGAPNYTFETGPDGRQYAIGGEVSVDLSTVPGDPTATIAKMQKVKAAALAPAQPSSQDFQVAATARKIITQEQNKQALEANEQKEAIVENGLKQMEAAQIAEDSGLSDEYQRVFAGLEKTIDSVNLFSEKIELGFDALMSGAVSDLVAPWEERSSETDERADRIESFYLDITRAYDKPPSYQFRLAI